MSLSKPQTIGLRYHLTILCLVMSHHIAYGAPTDITKGSTTGEGKTELLPRVLSLTVSVKTSDRAELRIPAENDLKDAIVLNEDAGFAITLGNPCGFSKDHSTCNLLTEYCDTVAGTYGTCQSCADACDPRRITASDYARASCNRHCKVYLWYKDYLEAAEQQKQKQLLLKRTSSTTDPSFGSLNSAKVVDSESDGTLTKFGMPVMGFVIGLLFMYSIAITIALVWFTKRRQKSSQMPSYYTDNVTRTQKSEPPNVLDEQSPTRKVKRGIDDSSGSNAIEEDDNSSISDKDRQSGWEPGHQNQFRVQQQAMQYISTPESACGRPATNPSLELSSEIPTTVTSLQQDSPVSTRRREVCAQVHEKSAHTVPSGQPHRDTSLPESGAADSEQPLLGGSISRTNSSVDRDDIRAAAGILT